MTPQGRMLGYVRLEDGYLIYYFYPPNTHLLELFTRSVYTVNVSILNPVSIEQTVIER